VFSIFLPEGDVGSEQNALSDRGMTTSGVFG
jgi:hypothetical protein